MREISTYNLSTIEQVKYQEQITLKQTVILGFGNELLGDEGVGVHAARQLKETLLPQTVKVVEVGTAILDALLALKHAERIIVLDSLKDGGTPGTVYKIPLSHHNGSPCIASMHSYEILRVMALAGSRRKEPLPIIVFGVEPEETSWPMTLSPAVTNSLPSLIEAIQAELKS